MCIGQVGCICVQNTHVVDASHLNCWLYLDPIQYTPMILYEMGGYNGQRTSGSAAAFPLVDRTWNVVVGVGIKIAMHTNTIYSNIYPKQATKGPCLRATRQFFKTKRKVIQTPLIFFFEQTQTPLMT